MSSTIKYKGNTIATAENNTKTLQTSGKYMEGDIEVTDVSSTEVGSYGTPTWQHAISQGSRLLIHPNFPDFDDGYMASAPNINDTLTLEAQTVTPSDSQQVVTPTDLNHYLQRVTVNPITYSASDEGKVVSNGALTAQTSRNITQNGTYDTTTNDEVVVNVSGGGGVDYLAKRLNNNENFVYESNDVTVVSAFSFRTCTMLVGLKIPNATTIGDNALFGCNGLTSLHFEKVTQLGNSACVGCLNLETIVFEKALNANGSNAMQNCSKLSKFDSGNGTGRIPGNCFAGCSTLNTLILRSSSVATLTSTNALNGTPFASSGTGGTLYVPQSLLSQYTQATNWSTILGYANNQILPIEGSIYENAYADGTPITA